MVRPDNVNLHTAKNALCTCVDAVIEAVEPPKVSATATVEANPQDRSAAAKAILRKNDQPLTQGSIQVTPDGGLQIIKPNGFWMRDNGN